MLDTDSPAMESNGNSFLPDLPVVNQTADWSMDQVPSEPLGSILPGHSGASQDGSGEPHTNQQMNAAAFGTAEKAVEQFQIASAQLFQEEQPPLPPLPAEGGDQPSEHAEPQIPTQEMTVVPEGAKDGTDGK